MGKRQRIRKPKRIQLPIYSESGSRVDLEDYYDLWDEDAWEESEVSYPKITKVIDGETAFFSAIKNGEDW